VVSTSGDTAEAKAIRPRSDSWWALVITTPGWMVTCHGGSRRVNKGALPSRGRGKAFGVLAPEDWSSGEGRAAPRCSASAVPAFPCPWRGLQAGRGSDERPAAAEVQSPAPWPEETAKPRKGCCCFRGAERTRTHLPVLLPPLSPSAEPCRPPRRGPQTVLRCARACAGSSDLLACLQFPGSDLLSAPSFQRTGRQRPRGVWLGAIRLLLAPRWCSAPDNDFSSLWAPQNLLTNISRNCLIN